MNLRLSPEAEEAVRREAERTGRSQQPVIREAIGRHLGLVAGERARSELGVLVSMGNVRPANALWQGRQPSYAATGSDQRRSS